MRYLVLTKDSKLLPLPLFVIVEGHTPHSIPVHHFGGTLYISGRKEPDEFRGSIPLAKNINLQDLWVVDQDGMVVRCMANQVSFSGCEAHCSGVVLQKYQPNNVAELAATVAEILRIS